MQVLVCVTASATTLRGWKNKLQISATPPNSLRISTSYSDHLGCHWPVPVIHPMSSEWGCPQGFTSPLQCRKYLKSASLRLHGSRYYPLPLISDGPKTRVPLAQTFSSITRHSSLTGRQNSCRFPQPPTAALLDDSILILILIMDAAQLFFHRARVIRHKTIWQCACKRRLLKLIWLWYCWLIDIDYFWL